MSMTVDAAETTQGRRLRLAAGFDGILLGTVLATASYGLVMISSASALEASTDYGDAFHFVWRQAAGLMLGLSFAVTLIAMPYGTIRRFGFPVYLFTLALLAVVITPIGHEANGATRWIAIGSVHVQPSEIARLSIVWVLADYLANNRGRLTDMIGVGLPGLALVLPLVVMVIFQRDFGSTALLLGLTGVLLFVAGLQWRWLASGAVCASSLLAVLVLVEPYRIRRLTSFLDPFADPSGDGYQVVQGFIALATGGMFGTGVAAGVAQRGFLPEAHTDFIGAVIGEELGAIGLFAVVALQFVLVWRSFVIAERAPDLFGLLVAVGVGAWFSVQGIVNLGVVGGLLPAKGLVLPFVSYGASAAVVYVTAVGLLLKVGLEGARANAEAGGG